jgi:predicted MFS family arabinose efflux permease
LIGIDVYAVLYLQAVLGFSPTIAGLAILPMSISWFTASFLMGRILLRFNAKLVVIVSAVINVACGILFILLDESSSLFFAVFVLFLSGLGLGGLLTSTTIIIQESVGYSKRGTAMGINSFVKSIGQALGITTLGVMLNVRLDSFFAELGLSGVDSSTLLQGSAIVLDSGMQAELGSGVIVTAIDTGIDFLFWIMLICAVVLTLIALFIPNVQLGKGTLDEQPK